MENLILDSFKTGVPLSTVKGVPVRIICVDKKTLTGFPVIGLADYGFEEIEIPYTLKGTTKSSYQQLIAH